MFKKNIAKAATIATIMSLCLAPLAGCGIEINTNNSTTANTNITASSASNNSNNSSSSASSNDSGNTSATTATEAPKPTESSVIKAVRVDSETVYDEDHLHYLIMNGYDAKGNLIWSKQSDRFPLAQVDRVCFLGYDERFCYYQDEWAFVALNMTNGEIALLTEAFKGMDHGISCHQFEDGILYGECALMNVSAVWAIDAQKGTLVGKYTPSNACIQVKYGDKYIYCANANYSNNSHSVDRIDKKTFSYTTFSNTTLDKITIE